MYKTIVYFEDLQDGGRPYNPGDIFPREGLSVTAERLNELSTAENRRKCPLIQFYEDERANTQPDGEKPQKRRRTPKKG